MTDKRMHDINTRIKHLQGKPNRAKYLRLYRKEHRKELNKKHKEYVREMRMIAREIGNCSHCFKPKDNPNFKTCSRCREYYRNLFRLTP